MANNVDPDQTPRSVASDLGLHCLLSLTVPKVIVITVITCSLKEFLLSPSFSRKFCITVREHFSISVFRI